MSFAVFAFFLCQIPTRTEATITPTTMVVRTTTVARDTLATRVVADLAADRAASKDPGILGSMDDAK